jgi:hypothetical protein
MLGVCKFMLGGGLYYGSVSLCARAIELVRVAVFGGAASETKPAKALWNKGLGGVASGFGRYYGGGYGFDPSPRGASAEGVPE